MSLNTWFLNRQEKSDFHSVIEKLIGRGIDFIKLDTPTGLVLRLQSGVELLFEKYGKQRLAALSKGKTVLPDWVCAMA